MLTNYSKRIHMNTTLTYGSVLINNTKHNLVKAMTKLRHTSRLYSTKRLHKNYITNKNAPLTYNLMLGVHFIMP